MDGILWLLLWGIIWGFIGYLVGNAKGQAVSGVIWSLLLGPIGVIIVLALPKIEPEGAGPTPPTTSG
jgi:hypothetical protein